MYYKIGIIYICNFSLINGAFRVFWKHMSLLVSLNYVSLIIRY